MIIIDILLIAIFLLFRAVGLFSIIYNPYIIIIPSLVIIVSYNIAKLIVLIGQQSQTPTCI
jgi:hypothetical protein